MDLPLLIGRVQDPPLRKLGVLDLETFYPAKDRMDLVLKLNGLLASPTFAAWAQGMPLDVPSMLFQEGGGPRCAVVSLAAVVSGAAPVRPFSASSMARIWSIARWHRRPAGTLDTPCAARAPWPALRPGSRGAPR